MRNMRTGSAPISTTSASPTLHPASSSGVAVTPTLAPKYPPGHALHGRQVALVVVISELGLSNNIRLAEQTTGIDVILDSPDSMAAAAAWDREHTFPRQVFAKLGELGLMGVPYPAEHGGSDAGTLWMREST